MNRKIYRNLAVVTAVFALALAVMLTVSRVQMRHTSPLQSQVMETLKELYESNPAAPISRRRASSRAEYRFSA